MTPQPEDLGFEIGVATHTFDDSHFCGDHYAVYRNPHSTVIVVVDGLGHGKDAAHAAKQALLTAEKHSNESVPEIIRSCHEAISRTRGVAMSLARVEHERGRMGWLGIGNVEGMLIREKGCQRPAAGSLPVRGGVVGARLPRLIVSDLEIGRGDMLLFATDGIRPHFADAPECIGPCGMIARRILERFGKKNDDALILVARYVGTAR